MPSTTWAETQIDRLPTDWTADQKKPVSEIIRGMQELFDSQANFIRHLSFLERSLSFISTQMDLSQEELRTINAYLEQLRKLSALNETLDFHTYSEGEIVSVMQTAFITRDIYAVDSDLLSKFQSDEFKELLRTMGNLEIARDQINSIYHRIEQVLTANPEYAQIMTTEAMVGNHRLEGQMEIKVLTNLTSMPIERMMKYNQFIKDIFIKKIGNVPQDWLERFSDGSLIKNASVIHEANAFLINEISAVIDVHADIEACEHALESKKTQFKGKTREAAKKFKNLITKNSGSATEVSSNDIPSTDTPKQKKFLRLILDKNLNIEHAKLATNCHYADAYLKLMLPRIYPELFGVDSQGKFQVRSDANAHRSPEYALIMQALGLHNSLMRNPTADLTLNPAQFDARALGQLSSQTHSLLWVVLKSIKPVDNKNFFANDKIAAYRTLALAFKAYDLSLIQEDRYKNVGNLIKCATTLAIDYPECESNVGIYFRRREGTFTKETENFAEWLARKAPDNPIIKISNSSTRTHESSTSDTDSIATASSMISGEHWAMNSPALEEKVDDNDTENRLIDASRALGARLQLEREESEQTISKPVIGSDISISTLSEGPQTGSHEKTNSLRKNLDWAIRLLDKAVNIIGYLVEKLSRLNLKLNATEEKNQQLTAEVEALTAQNHQLAESARSIQGELTTAQAELSQKRQEAQELSNEVAGLRATLADKDQNLTTLTTQCQHLRTTVDEAAFSLFFRKFRHKFTGANKTNSDGILEMIHCMDNLDRNMEKTSAEKFAETTQHMQRIAGKRLAQSWWSESHFFGKGRSQEVRELYALMNEATFTLDAETQERLIRQEVVFTPAPTEETPLLTPASI